MESMNGAWLALGVAGAVAAAGAAMGRGGSMAHAFKTKFNRDGTVTIWDTHSGSWDRTSSPTDTQLAALPATERHRVTQHLIRMSMRPASGSRDLDDEPASGMGGFSERQPSLPPDRVWLEVQDPCEPLQRGRGHGQQNPDGEDAQRASRLVCFRLARPGRRTRLWLAGQNVNPQPPRRWTFIWSKRRFQGIRNPQDLWSRPHLLRRTDRWRRGGYASLRAQHQGRGDGLSPPEVRQSVSEASTYTHAKQAETGKTKQA